MSNEQQVKDEPTPSAPGAANQQEKQCRICFDSDEYNKRKHHQVQLAKRVAFSITHNNAFWRCPQCHFHYRFARTKAFGLGTNPVVVGVLSTFLFTLLVMFSSYVTSYFLTSIEEQSVFGTSYFFVSPIEVAHDLVRASIRILRDQDILPPELHLPRLLQMPAPPRVPDPPGLLGRFVRRFLLGLPMVGVGSLIHMLLTLPFIGPLQWIARWRGNRTRRGSDRDIAAALIVIFIIIGAARALFKVYGYTRKCAERFLTWAEDSILEVN